jgi:hypothetical protein
MKNRTKSRTPLRIVSGLLFTAGLLVAMAVTFITFWPDMEASLFDSSRQAEESLPSLRCPLIVSSNETAMIRVTFENPVDRDVRFLLRTNIAQGGLTLMRREEGVVELTPNEERELTFEADPDDAAFGRLVLARVYAFRNPPLPSRTGSCGVLVLDLPSWLNGTRLILLALGASFVLLAAGSALWLRDALPLSTNDRSLARAGGVLLGVTLGGLVLSLFGFWGFGVAAFIFNLIFLGAVLERFLSGGVDSGGRGLI